jgi:hypothetical protein
LGPEGHYVEDVAVVVEGVEAVGVCVEESGEDLGGFVEFYERQLSMITVEGGRKGRETDLWSGKGVELVQFLGRRMWGRCLRGRKIDGGFRVLSGSSLESSGGRTSTPWGFEGVGGRWIEAPRSFRLDHLVLTMPPNSTDIDVRILKANALLLYHSSL